MDRALDDIVNEGRSRDSFRGGRRDRKDRPPREGIRKVANSRTIAIVISIVPTDQWRQSQRDEPRNLDRDWVHDRYDDDRDREDRRAPRGGHRTAPRSRPSPEADLAQQGVQLKIENLHYDLTEDDIRDLFESKGPTLSVRVLYDRQDRSRGIAFVVMGDERDADRAIREFDGANARGQPIRVSREAFRAPKARNPFDHAERPTKSLFDRVEPRRRSASPEGYERPRRGGRSGGTGRALTPENIDRYVPGQSDRRRSPLRRNRDGHREGRGGRGPGQRRERERSERRDKVGHVLVGGRPKKTQEELDAEMEDYWGKTGGGQAPVATETNGNGAVPVAAAAGGDDDIDMIE